MLKRKLEKYLSSLVFFTPTDQDYNLDTPSCLVKTGTCLPVIMVCNLAYKHWQPVYFTKTNKERACDPETWYRAAQSFFSTEYFLKERPS